MHVQAVIAALDYDFTSFKINHFLKHIETKRGRSLNVKRYPFASELFALCYATAQSDHIIVNSTLHRVHQMHCVLHEVAHLYLGHSGVDLCTALGENLCGELGLTGKVGHLRTAQRPEHINTLQEQEAELFVFDIQQQIVAANRFYELHSPSAISELQPYIKGLDFNH